MSAQDVRIPTTTATALSVTPPTSVYRSRFPEIQNPQSNNGITLSPQTLELQRERLRNLRMNTITDATICLSVVGLFALVAFLLFTNSLFIKVS